MLWYAYNFIFCLSYLTNYCLHIRSCKRELIKLFLASLKHRIRLSGWIDRQTEVYTDGHWAGLWKQKNYKKTRKMTDMATYIQTEEVWELKVYFFVKWQGKNRKLYAFFHMTHFTLKICMPEWMISFCSSSIYFYHCE